MSKVNTLLSQRTEKRNRSSKMQQLAQQSVDGSLTPFTGMFAVTELNDCEKEYLEAILQEYGTGENDFDEDLNSLISITSEVKAINNQAAILHGERVKKAHNILVQYQDGAFTAWLTATYGNRQTPYNFMQYYEFYVAIPKPLRPQLELMPRQAIYSLASREGSLDKKQEIVENYNGETKAEVLHIIREVFPLDDHDKRRQNLGEATIKSLQRISSTLKSGRVSFSRTQKRAAYDLLSHIQDLIEECKTRT